MFRSILYPGGERIGLSAAAPSCFADLNLDRLFRMILQDIKEYGMQSVFYSPLREARDIAYRQEIMREMEDSAVRSRFSALSDTVCARVSAAEAVKELFMSFITASFDAKPRPNYFARGDLLRCVSDYCGEIAGLAEDISALTLKSEGLRGFAAYLAEYADSPRFTEMRSHAAALREKLKSVEYSMLMRTGGKGSKILKVRKYGGEEACSAENLDAMFRKFKQSKGEMSEKKADLSMYTRTQLQAYPDLEAAANIVLEMVASAHKDVFNDLYNFCVKYSDHMDDTLARFAREIRFYIGWHEQTAQIRAAGLPMCYPEMITGGGDIFVRGMYDLALAHRQRGEGIVTNDFELNALERVVIVTGPNQGGKSTLSRSFGQAHYLASLGLSVPGSEARLFLCDKVLTHFGKQEDIIRQRGQLQDDLLRLKEMFDQATPRSILIINEILASTTLEDALNIGGKMMDKLTALGVPAFVITFLDELAERGANIVSVAGVIDEDDPEKRTFKFTRKPPNSAAYAAHIARKYGLTFEDMDRRLGAICQQRR